MLMSRADSISGTTCMPARTAARYQSQYDRSRPVRRMHMWPLAYDHLHHELPPEISFAQGTACAIEDVILTRGRPS